jgi:hypothetical protein
MYDRPTEMHPRRHPASCVLLVSVILALAVPLRASAFSSGVTTDAFAIPANGCNNCHSGGTAPGVELTGPMEVQAGATNEYTFQVTTPRKQNHAGLNVSAPAGTFAIGGADSTGTQLRENFRTQRDEVTHNAPKLAVGGVVAFSFLWTAPDTPGMTTLSAWGNAVNFNGNNSGDRAANAMLTVNVIAADAPTPTATPTPTPTPVLATCPGDCNGDARVTVEEILIGVNIALQTRPVADCLPLDVNDDGMVTVDELLGAVNLAMAGCGR